GSLWATQEIGMSSQLLGLFMTVNSLSAIVISTLFGRWSDSHLPRRSLLLLGAAAGALANLGYAVVRDPLLLTVIGSSLLGLASMNFAQLFAHVREELGRPEHDGADAPFLMGVLRACYALAWMVGPNLGAWIKGRVGYPGLFSTTAGFFLLLAGCVVLFVEHRPRVAADATSPVSAGNPLPGAGLALSSADEPPLSKVPEGRFAAWGLTEPGVLAHAAAFGLMFAAFTLNTLNLPLFLTEKLGETERTVGAAFSISPLFEMLFMVGFGYLAARGHQKRIILIGTSAAVCYFIGLRFVSAAWQVYPLQILNASAVAVVTSVAIPFFQDLLPRRAGIATSLYSNALKAGSLVGFMTFGLLASRVGNAGLFLVCAGLGATTVALLALSPRRTPEPATLTKNASA
ncbi:MAG TPA: MFS transporter, partial [Polyangiaceae bacterium]|nr:MFS transporter [Polyangiaceae bacterium]